MVINGDTWTTCLKHSFGSIYSYCSSQPTPRIIEITLITICSHWFVDMLQRNTRQNHQQHEQRQRCCHPTAPTIIIPTLAETAITTSNSKHQSTSWDSPLKSFWTNLKTNLFFQLLSCPDRALVPHGFRGSWAGNGHGGANVVVGKSRSKTVAKGGGRIKWSSSIIAKAAGNRCCKSV